MIWQHAPIHGDRNPRITYVLKLSKTPSRKVAMAKTNMPWSIKGVSMEARAAAKEAAAAGSMTIGAWLDQTILGAAIGQLADTQDDRLAAAARATESLPEDPVIDAIQRLAAKVAATEQRTADMAAPLRKLVEQLTNRVEDMERQVQPAAALRARRR